MHRAADRGGQRFHRRHSRRAGTLPGTARGVAVQLQCAPQRRRRPQRGTAPRRGPLADVRGQRRLLLPGAIRTLLEAAQRLDADVVQGGWQYLYTDGTRGPVQRYPAAVYTGAAAPERFELPGMPWGKVYRRELFAQVRFPAYYTCFEDAIIHFLVFRLAKTVASVPEMVYLWRKNPKGLTATSQHRPAAVQSYWIMEQLAVQDAALGLPHDALYRCTLTLQLSAFCYATVSGLPPETQQAVFRLCCALYAKALPQEGALPRRARWGARALRQQDFGLWCRYGRRFQLL